MFNADADSPLLVRTSMLSVAECCCRVLLIGHVITVAVAL